MNKRMLSFSINPEVDIGQIEGAFIMGLGYYFTEHSIYDKDSGQYLTGSILVSEEIIVIGNELMDSRLVLVEQDKTL